MTVRVGLVGCVKSKLSVPAPAEELYVSPLFRGRRAVVQRTCDRWFILSAAHGLVAPQQVLDPYDVTLNSVGRRQRRDWAVQVLCQIDVEFAGLATAVFEVHAGSAYTDHGLVDGLQAGGATVELPVAGMALGQQLAFYAQQPAASGPATDARMRTPAASSGMSSRSPKYAPITDWLRSQPREMAEVSFAELEHVLGFPLPSSARRHRPWWANTPQGQASSWLAAGWKVDRVDLARQQVRFVQEEPHE